MAVVCVLGAGRMGTAFCTPLLDNGHRVRLVGTHLDTAYVDALRATGVHPGLENPLPEGATFHQVEALAEALNGADVLAIGVSSAGIPWASEKLAPTMHPGTPLLFVTKGLEWDGSGLRPEPDVFLDGLPGSLRQTLRPVGVTGPCIAGELIRRRETCVTFAGRDETATKLWADLSATAYYHVWRSEDFLGCEASAALKNAFAIATGFGAGALEGAGGSAGRSPELLGVAAHNFEAAVFAEAVVEMDEIVKLIGGRPGTATGLVGAGDLLVTTYARNARLGRLLGRGLRLEDAVAEMAGATLEGLATVRTIGVALETWDASGRTGPGQLPLMRHLVEVSRGGAVAVPFDRFFGGRG